MIPPRCLGPLPAPPPGAEALYYRDDLRPVRELAGRHATAAGLSRQQVTDLVLAVSELAANTLRHTGGGGVVRAWQAAGELVCEIRDQGMITDPLAGRRPPARDDTGGHGLWLVNQVCDLVETRTSPAGTVFRLHMRSMCLPGPG
jgi:anti-sigma regulatory factor (Ser/Thr protein kinase)